MWNGVKASVKYCGRKSLDITDWFRWGVDLHCCYAVRFISSLVSLRMNVWLVLSMSLHYWIVKGIVKRLRIYSLASNMNLFIFNDFFSWYKCINLEILTLIQQKLLWNNSSCCNNNEFWRVNLRPNDLLCFMLLIWVKYNRKTNVLSYSHTQ